MTLTASWAEPSSDSFVDSRPSNQFLNRPGWFERAGVFVALFTYAWGTPLEWLAFATGGSVESSALTQLLFLGFLLLSVVSLNGNWHIALKAAKGEPLMAAFVALAVASTVWSTAPAETLREGITLSVAYVFALHLIVRFSIREIVTMLAATFAIGAILNLAFVAIFADLGSLSVGTDGSRGWSGITGNRNTLGRAAVLGFAVCVIQARTVRSLVWWPGFALLNAMLAIGSNSATTLGALGGICILGTIFVGFRGRKTLYGATMVAMGIVFSTLTVLAATNLAATTGLIGRDSSFTGRLPIWIDAFVYGVSERPLLGYGREGFWGQGFHDFDVQLRTNENFNTPHAHNAWVDAWLEVGPLGAILLTAIIVRGLLWGTRRIRAVPTAIGMFPAVIISLAVVYSATEAGFISRSVQFIMLIVAVTEASRQKGVAEPWEPRSGSLPDPVDR